VVNRWSEFEVRSAMVGRDCDGPTLGLYPRFYHVIMNFTSLSARLLHLGRSARPRHPTRQIRWASKNTWDRKSGSDFKRHDSFQLGELLPLVSESWFGLTHSVKHATQAHQKLVSDRFELDSHPGDAVLIAPVSTVLIGNFTGKIAILRLLGSSPQRETPVLQPLWSNSPVN
jgi:hypothetical protein